MQLTNTAVIPNGSVVRVNFVKTMGAYACSKASRAMDKNAGSLFEQRKALARLRAHLRDEVRNRPR
jgi:hypothetical protein